MIASLARIGSSANGLRRNLNCWTAAIAKKHRAVYERTYPTTLVFSDGSSIEIEYHEPRKIIILPLNLAELTEVEQKKRLEMRKPKTKVVITDEIEDSFDENRYLNFNKWLMSQRFWNLHYIALFIRKYILITLWKDDVFLFSVFTFKWLCIHFFDNKNKYINDVHTINDVIVISFCDT